MKVVDPVQIRRFAVIPRPVLELTGTAVLHRRAGQLPIRRVSGVFCRPGQNRGPEHVRVVYRILLEGKVADAGSAPGPLAGKRGNPVADAGGYLEISRISQDFIPVEKSLPYQGRPDDDGIVLGISAEAAGEVEVVRPGVFREFRGLVPDQPSETPLRPFPVGQVACYSIHDEVSGSHVPPPLRGLQRPDTEKGSQVQRALPNQLEQQPIQEKVPECQWPENGGQAIERLVSLVMMILDPTLDLADAFLEAGFTFVLQPVPPDGSCRAGYFSGVASVPFCGIARVPSGWDGPSG